MLMRTGENEDLSPEAHERLAEGLDLLGTAYANLGDLDAANEVLRLGVQWAGESSKAADLFLTLGRASAASEKHGEAIGLLRRAIRLGIEEQEVLPLLAESLAARDQWLAAMACLAKAGPRASGGSASDLEQRLRDRLGAPWARFEQWLGEAE
jgi:tetratricopeptide (TPR) repeat protein